MSNRKNYPATKLNFVLFRNALESKDGLVHMRYYYLVARNGDDWFVPFTAVWNEKDECFYEGMYGNDDEERYFKEKDIINIRHEDLWIAELVLPQF